MRTKNSLVTFRLGSIWITSVETDDVSDLTTSNQSHVARISCVAGHIQPPMPQRRTAQQDMSTRLPTPGGTATVGCVSPVVAPETALERKAVNILVNERHAHAATHMTR